jgi:hypothetical protein
MIASQTAEPQRALRLINQGKALILACFHKFAFLKARFLMAITKISRFV